MKSIWLLETGNINSDCYECGYSIDILKNVYPPMEVTDEEYQALKMFSKFKVVEILNKTEIKDEINDCLNKIKVYKEREAKRAEKAAKLKDRAEKNRLKNLRKQKELIEQKIKETLNNAN